MFMCVGTIEWFSRREDYSSDDIVTWLSRSEDKLDIVDEATLDENTHEDHLGGP